METAFERVSAWSVPLLAVFFRHCRQPHAAARERARRWVRAGNLCSAKLDAPEIPGVTGPLATSFDSSPPDFGRLSHFALKRLSAPATPTTIYWPSGQFAKRHGSWTGRDTLPNPLQIGHSLLCTAVWIRMLRTHGVVAISGWTSEHELQFRARREARRGPIPDALMSRDGKTIAIEVLGKYPATWIEHHVQQFDSDSEFDGWELW